MEMTNRDRNAKQMRESRDRSGDEQSTKNEDEESRTKKRCDEDNENGNATPRSFNQQTQG